MWRAHHVASGTAVAVKVWSGARGRAALDAFGREVRAMAALDHPGILQVLDHGATEGRPYIVCELAVRSAPAVAGSWREALGVLLAVLDGLAHAHARGVVHRDLKPGNVLGVTDAGSEVRWKVADFGIATALGAAAEQVAGTPAYMAPEQILGRPLGPATDLYALGCMTWQMLSGAPPFEGGAREVMEAHLGRPVPELRARFTVPDGLEGWLGRLLAKLPQQRFELAADAAHALASLGAPAETASAAPVQVAVPGATTYAFDFDVAAPSRSPEDTSPTQPMRRAAPPPWTAPLPPPRSHLHAAGAGLAALRVPRMVGRVAERDALWALLSTVVQTRRAHSISVIGTPGVGVSRVAAWVAERASELGVARGIRGPTSLRELRAATGNRAGVWVLDPPDAHDLDLLERIEGPLGRDLPVLAVVAGAGCAAEVSLEPLSDAQVAEILHDLLGLDAALAMRIASRSGGNPQLAVLRTTQWVELGVLRAGPHGFRLADPEPQLTGELAEVWRRRTPAVVSAAVEVGAALGSRVDEATWRAVCAELGVPALGLEPLERAGLVAAAPGGWRFAHPMVREVIATRATDRMVPIHLACATARAGDPLAAGAHLAAAGSVDAARRALLVGAREAWRRADHRTVLLALDRLDALGGPVSDEADALRVFALRARGDHASALDVAERVLGTCAVSDVRVEVLLEVATIHRNAGQLDRVRGILEQLRAEPAVQADAGRRGAVRAMAGTVAFSRERPDLAIPEFEEAARLQRAAGDLRALRGTLYNLASARVEVGDFDEALARIDELDGVHERGGMVDGGAWSATVRAQVDLRRGDLAGAEDRLARLAAQCHELGDLLGYGRAANNRGFAAVLDGRLSDAAIHFRDALAVAAHLGETDMLVPRINLGMVELERGAPAAARSVLELAAEEVRVGGRATWAALVAMLLALCAEGPTRAAEVEAAARELASSDLADPQFARILAAEARATGSRSVWSAVARQAAQLGDAELAAEAARALAE